MHIMIFEVYFLMNKYIKNKKDGFKYSKYLTFSIVRCHNLTTYFKLQLLFISNSSYLPHFDANLHFVSSSGILRACQLNM